MPFPLFKSYSEGSIRHYSNIDGGTRRMRYHVLSDRHKKSATRIEGGLSPPSSIDLNIAMIGKIFEMAKIGEKEKRSS